MKNSQRFRTLYAANQKLIYEHSPSCYAMLEYDLSRIRKALISQKRKKAPFCEFIEFESDEKSEKKKIISAAP